ncbi:hydroxycinnamoyltransferase-like [Triticum dicoccoides]|uniref:hydroxycinnamoyltransferase-like n=1 Tax=Triticum dicoccoides TaxID=85692 RepID=UPI00188E9F12|nr:hydroxycinnamoyltransferase-like [Triticum dicoccoides]
MANDSWRVRVIRRSTVKASITRPGAVLPVSNLDLLYYPMPLSMVCAYRRPSAGGGFADVVAAFDAKLPSLLDHFFPLAGRIVANPRSGLPEVHCDNQGAELVVGEAGVAPAGLDFGDLDASLARVGVPVQYAADVALSVQLLSLACGGFVVAWSTNHGLADGCALCMIVDAWSQLARSGTIVAAPNYDRSVFRPRAAPSYGPSVGDLFMPLASERVVNALTARGSLVGRTYYVEERDLTMLRAQASVDGERGASRVEAVSAYLWKVFAATVGSSDDSCRMGWWVNGRRRLTAAPEEAIRNYVGNVTTFAVVEASVDAIQRRPLPEIASMVRESIRSTATDEHFQELVDWVEEHKGKGNGKAKAAVNKFVETATVGLGSPAMGVTSFTSFSVDTDLGFGHAAVAMPTWVDCGRLCSGFVKIMARPEGHGGGGSWIFGMSVWPKLAAALDSDEQRIFKPLTADYLGLMPQAN